MDFHENAGTIIMPEEDVDETAADLKGTPPIPGHADRYQKCDPLFKSKFLAFGFKKGILIKIIVILRLAISDSNCAVI